jgi:cysteine protease ATG4
LEHFYYIMQLLYSEKECSFELESPLWILGKKYDTFTKEILDNIKLDFKSIFYFTYRKNFEEVINYTTDAGWGCMLRTGQMLICQAFKQHYFGRDSNIKDFKNEKNVNNYKNLLELFYDQIDSPFSVQKIALIGTLFNKNVGKNKLDNMR